MENKYYTPEIEEFHQGFEYEYKYKNQDWVKTTFDAGAGDTDYMAGDWYEFSPNSSQTICRVKYLDGKDIEECEWHNAVGEKWFYKDHKDITRQSNEYFLNGKIVDSDSYEMLFSPEDNYVSISDYESRIIFQGTIKNKSELKVLLKQLGIK